MDGASKFVRGDAVAGLMILMINNCHANNVNTQTDDENHGNDGSDDDIGVGNVTGGGDVTWLMLLLLLLLTTMIMSMFCQCFVSVVSLFCHCFVIVVSLCCQCFVICRCVVVV